MWDILKKIDPESVWLRSEKFGDIGMIIFNKEITTGFFSGMGNQPIVAAGRPAGVSRGPSDLRATSAMPCNACDRRQALSLGDYLLLFIVASLFAFL